MTTTPTRFRGEQQANTVESGQQFQQKVVGLADGTFVVLWTSDANVGAGSDDGNDIIGQRFDAEGNRIGGEFQANRTFFVDDETLSDAKALPNGNFVIVYEDRDASGVALRFDILSPTGVKVDGGTIRSDPGADTLGSASIAVAPDGSFMVAYDRGNGTTEVVKVDGAGNVGVPDIAIAHNESFSSTAITRLDNGNFVVVTEDGFQGDAGLAFRLIDAGGNSLGVATPLANTRTNGDADFRPAVVGLTGGGFVASWVNIDSNDDDLEFQVFDAAGNTVGNVRTVNAGGSNDNNDDATMVALSDGGFVIGYTDDEDQSIKMQRYDANGNEVGAEVTVTNQANTTFSLFPHIALSSDGRLLVTWGELANSTADQDVEVAIFDPRGETITGSSAGETITSRIDGATVFAFGGNDKLLGQRDDDDLNGGSGNDYLRGGRGADILDGGSNADRFDFNAVVESTVGAAGRDTIEDFSRAEKDRIDLSTIDANTGLAGNQAFKFVGDNAFTGAGQVRFTQSGGDTFVRISVDADASNEMIIKVEGTVNFVAADFIL